MAGSYRTYVSYVASKLGADQRRSSIAGSVTD